MKMTYPKVIWNCNKRTEAERIIHIASMIVNYFYEKRGIYILPYNTLGNGKAIYFPHLNFALIPHFWERIKKEGKEIIHDEQFVKQVEGLLPDVTMDSDAMQRKWLSVEKKFWSLMQTLAPRWFTEITEIEVRVTQYGSAGTSYSNWAHNKPNKITIYVRKDATAGNLIGALILERLSVMDHGVEYTWEELMAIKDYMLTETTLHDLVPEKESLLASIRQKQQGDLAEASQQYYHKLGIPTGEVFSTSGDRVLVHQKETEVILRHEEFKALKYFIENKNKIVSYDDLADVIWGKDSYDKFSLQSMAKLMQRVREKIEAMGVFPQIIQTVKKSGYMLVD